MPNAAQLRAIRLLRDFGVTVPPTPDGLVYSLNPGKLVVKMHDMPDELPGLLAYGEVRSVIWLRRDDPLTRRRFSLWHEIGHYLMHQGTYYCYAMGTQELQTEREANTFAATALMPAEWVWADVSRLGNDPIRMARRYQVSVGAMRRRFRELGIG